MLVAARYRWKAMSRVDHHLGLEQRRMIKFCVGGGAMDIRDFVYDWPT
jgi:hypothetical protein